MFERFKKLFKKEEPEMDQDEKEDKNSIVAIDEKSLDDRTDNERAVEKVPSGAGDISEGANDVGGSEESTEVASEEPNKETRDDSENFKEVIAAQSAKITSLESELDALKARFDELMNKDEGKDFGGQVTVPEGDPTEDKRNAVFESYAGSKAKNYY